VLFRSLKKVFYHVAKEERNRLKHNRFRISWHILVENQLIETCMLHQVENGFTDLPIEIFLAMPEVSVLPLVLDHERLGDVLGVISRVSREIVLEEAVRNQKEYADLNKNRERLEREKKAEIERVDREMTESLKLIPHDQIVQMLAKLSEERDRKKEIVLQHFMLLDQKMVQNSTNRKKNLDEKVAVIRNRLEIEIQEELKDFDQLMEDRRKEEIARQERKRVWRRNMFLLGGLVLSVMGGLWVWSGILEDRKRVAKLVLEEIQREEAIIQQAQDEAERLAKLDAEELAEKQPEKIQQINSLRGNDLLKNLGGGDSGTTIPPPVIGSSNSNRDDLLEKLGKSDVLGSIQPQIPNVKRCSERDPSLTGTVKVKIQVANTGNVTAANVENDPFAGTPVGSCVERVVKGIKFPAFSNPSISFTFPFALP
jgi:hypothetical protein